MTESAASHIQVGRVERASYFTPDNATVSQCRHVSRVKFNYDNPNSFALKAPNVTADERAHGLTARGLVSSQLRTFPFCSPLPADKVRSATRIGPILPVRP